MPTEIKSSPESPTIGILYEARAFEAAGGEPVDLIEVYVDHLGADKVNQYLSYNLKLNGLESGWYLPRTYAGDHRNPAVYVPNAWQRNAFMNTFPERWEPSPSNPDVKNFRLSHDDMDKLLQDPNTLNEMYSRINAKLEEDDAQASIGEYKDDPNAKQFDTIEEAIAEAGFRVACKSLNVDLINASVEAQTPEDLAWCFGKMANTDLKAQGFAMRPAYANAGVLAYGLRQFIRRVSAAKAIEAPDKFDDYLEVASAALAEFSNGKGRNDEKATHYNRIFTAVGGDTKLREAVEKDDQEYLAKNMKPEDFFEYKLGRKDFPEIFSRDYYLKRIKSCTSTPVKPGNVKEFNEFEEMLLVVQPNYAGKFIADSIDLTRSIFSELADKGSKNAQIFGTLLKKVASNAGGISAEAVVKLSNQIAPKEVHGEQLRELNPKSIEDFPLALARIISVARKDAEVDEASDEVIDAATQCSLLMANVGVDNKLAQKGLTVGDLIVRYPKLNAQGISALMNKLERTKREQNVHKLYRELKSRRKNAPYFGRWAAGGVLS